MFQAFIHWWENYPITGIFFNFHYIGQAFLPILKCLPVSLLLGVIGFVLGIPGGLLVSFMKMSKVKPLRWLMTAYIDVVRGTPMFLQILIIYFGFPFIPGYKALQMPLKQIVFFQIDLTIWLRALFIIFINTAAYQAEIFRAGIQSIPKGQNEAARSLGMGKWQTMGFVILPQTIRRILPTMLSEFILVFKDTSLFAAVSVFEMVMQAKVIAAATYNQSALIVTAFFYLLITIPLGRFVARMENKLAEQDGGDGGAVASPRAKRGKRPPRLDDTVGDSAHVVSHRENVLNSEVS
ncbi:MAG: amino acid ABC transporter permease [Coriobacteriia bacterium]|nr:amino acid ABC transporter permease [Coriobacteriia bacterium]